MPITIDNATFATYSVAQVNSLDPQILNVIANNGGWANWLTNPGNNVSLLSGTAQLSIPLATLDSLPDSILNVVGPQLGANILGLQITTSQGTDYWNFFQNASSRILNATAANVLSLSMLNTWARANAAANAVSHFGNLTTQTLNGITGATVSTLTIEFNSSVWTAGVIAWINQHCASSSGADFFNLNLNFQQAWFIPMVISATWLNAQVTANSAFNSAIASANLKNWLNKAATSDIQSLSADFLNSLTPIALSAMTGQMGTTTSTFTDIWLAGAGHSIANLSAQTFASALNANGLNALVSSVNGQSWPFGTVSAAQFSAWLALNISLKDSAGNPTGSYLTNNIAALNASTLNVLVAHENGNIFQALTVPQWSSWLANSNNKFSDFSVPAINALAQSSYNLLSNLSVTVADSWLNSLLTGNTTSLAQLSVAAINELTQITGSQLSQGGAVSSGFWSAWTASNSSYAGLSGLALNNLLSSGAAGISTNAATYANWLANAVPSDLAFLSSSAWGKFQASDIAAFIVQMGLPNLSTSVLNNLAHYLASWLLPFLQRV